MKIKIIENFESSFNLKIKEKEALFQLLRNESFLQQVSKESQCEKVDFTELLFQPVPYSLETPKGMPVEFETYLNSSEYIIINVPPNFMFKTKIFKPSRLCAIYHKIK